MRIIWQTRWTNRTTEVRAAAQGADDELRRRGADERARYAVQLVIDELMSNSIKYAFEDGGEHHIELRLSLGPDAVRVTLEDGGAPFEPGGCPGGESPGCRPLPTVGGMGIAMVRQVCASLRYRREAGRNVVEADVPLAPPCPRTPS
jgi:anti-sigma regulatory factor (Ser/Thr protein kinase)